MGDRGVYGASFESWSVKLHRGFKSHLICMKFNKNKIQYIVFLGFIIIYHIIVINHIYFVDLYTSPQKLAGTGLLVLTDTILILYLFKMPYQNELHIYPYTLKKKLTHRFNAFN